MERECANKVYKFVYDKDYYIKTNLIDREFENDWLKIYKNGKIKVKGTNKSGYAWDGCSPKYIILDLYLGTPDGATDYNTDKPYTYYASMIHDIIYQFKDNVTISRKEADIIFKLMLKDCKFFWWRIYYLMVRLFGGLYGKWETKYSKKDIKLE